MAELKTRKYVNFFGNIGSEGKTIDYTYGELEESKEKDRKLCEEESEMEKNLREEWALAAAKPKVYLTF